MKGKWQKIEEDELYCPLLPKPQIIHIIFSVFHDFFHRTYQILLISRFCSSFYVHTHINWQVAILLVYQTIIFNCIHKLQKLSENVDTMKSINRCLYSISTTSQLFKTCGMNSERQILWRNSNKINICIFNFRSSIISQSNWTHDKI